MNESHYPPSPSYYRRGNADARDLVTPSYWTDSALVHLMRAGRKDGEPFADAVRNAFVCLALWFRSQSLPVPYYSDALDRLQSRIAELESELTRIRTMAERVEVFQDEMAAATVARIRPVAPTLDAPPVEWTNDKLAEWLTAKHGRPTLNEDGDYAWPGCEVLRIGRCAAQNGDRPWCMADTHATRTLADALELTGAAP